MLMLTLNYRKKGLIPWTLLQLNSGLAHYQLQHVLPGPDPVHLCLGHDLVVLRYADLGLALDRVHVVDVLLVVDLIAVLMVSKEVVHYPAAEVETMTAVAAAEVLKAVEELLRGHS